MGIEYGWENFYGGLRYAIASEDSLQKRLEGCIKQILHLERESFLTDEMWKHFEQLISETTREPERYLVKELLRRQRAK